MAGGIPAIEPATASILVALVLYGTRAEDSPSWRSLQSALQADSSLPARFSLLIYDHSKDSDNSREVDTSLTPERATYIHDPRNLGLAEAYNYALALAEARGCAWLLLLDQDTQLTVDFLKEAVTAANDLHSQSDISAIVPKLRSPLGIKSPTLDFLDWLRRQFRLRRRPLFASESAYGVQQQQFSAFNSGSLLRVSAMRSIGGFCSDFPLDFLDTDTFFRLHLAGGRIFVLHACLEHGLSMDSPEFYTSDGPASLARHRSVLAATVRFVKRHGTASDRWLHRFWLLRNAYAVSRRTRDTRFARASLAMAFRYR